MLNFLISYWIAVVPTVVTGLILMGMARKMRNDKARQEKSLVPLTVREKEQE